MSEDSFFRYMYFPLTGERIPFRIYGNINRGWAGEWIGLELLNKNFLVDLFPDQYKQELVKKGLLIIGCRNLLLSTSAYSKLSNFGHDTWEDYNEIRIFAYPMDAFHLNIRAELQKFFDVINEGLKEELFSFTMSSEELYEARVSVSYSTDPVSVKVINAILHILSDYFDVCYDSFDGKLAYYILHLSNLIIFNNFAYKLMCNLYADFSNTSLTIAHISKKYISEWEKA